MGEQAGEDLLPDSLAVYLYMIPAGLAPLGERALAAELVADVTV
jgi:hypothetical protein